MKEEKLIAFFNDVIKIASENPNDAILGSELRKYLNKFVNTIKKGEN
jgi:hypothetical protein